MSQDSAMDTTDDFTPASSSTAFKKRVKKIDKADLEDGELSSETDDEEEPIKGENDKIEIDNYQKGFVALILIRQEATDLKTFSRALIELICTEVGIEINEVFSSLTMDDVANYVGDESYLVFQSIVNYYYNKQLLIPVLPHNSPPSFHASVLLTNLGM